MWLPQRLRSPETTRFSYNLSTNEDEDIEMAQMTLDLRAENTQDMANGLKGITLALEDSSGNAAWQAAVDADKDQSTFRGKFDWYDDAGNLEISAGGFADTDGEYGVSLQVIIRFGG